VTLLGAVVLAVVLGLLRMFVKPLVVLLTLPLTILTLGLFMLVVNALLVMLAAYIVPGFVVDGFWPALFFSVVVSLINLLFGQGWKI
jgi:putative membrane protein